MDFASVAGPVMAVAPCGATPPVRSPRPRDCQEFAADSRRQVARSGQPSAVQPGPGVGPVPVGGARGDAEGGGGLLEGQAGEVPELDQLGRRRVLARRGGRGPRPGRAGRRSGASGGRAGRPGRLGPARSPPCLRGRLRRAASTRMRRMASAAAAKKWPRPFQSGPASPPTSRRYASWTRAVGLERLARASRRPAGRRRASAARRRRAAAVARRRCGSPCSTADRMRVTSLMG